MLALAVVEAVGRWQALVATKELCGAQLSYEDTGLRPAMVLDTFALHWVCTGLYKFAPSHAFGHPHIAPIQTTARSKCS